MFLPFHWKKIWSAQVFFSNVAWKRLFPDKCHHQILENIFHTFTQNQKPWAQAIWLIDQRPLRVLRSKPREGCVPFRPKHFHVGSFFRYCGEAMAIRLCAARCLSLVGPFRGVVRSLPRPFLWPQPTKHTYSMGWKSHVFIWHLAWLLETGDQLIVVNGDWYKIAECGNWHLKIGFCDMWAVVVQINWHVKSDKKFNEQN